MLQLKNPYLNSVPWRIFPAIVSLQHPWWRWDWREWRFRSRGPCCLRKKRNIGLFSPKIASGKKNIPKTVARILEIKWTLQPIVRRGHDELPTQTSCTIIFGKSLKIYCWNLIRRITHQRRWSIFVVGFLFLLPRKLTWFTWKWGPPGKGDSNLGNHHFQVPWVINCHLFGGGGGGQTMQTFGSTKRSGQTNDPSRCSEGFFC